MSSDSIHEQKPNQGWAIASLVFGIIGILTSVALVGGLFGAVGILLALIHFAYRQRSNGVAWTGMTLSLLGIGLSVWLGVVYVRAMIAFVENVQKQIASQSEEPAMDSWKGVEAPDITVTSLDGESIKLSDLKGKRVIVDFWATWCGPCVREIPHFIELRESISEDELQIVGISEEDADTLKAFVKRYNVNYPIASASGLPAPYSKVEGIPTTFFIDRNGIIQDIVVGYHDLDHLKSLATATDYAGPAKSAPSAPSSGLTPADVPRNLTKSWTLEIPQAQAICTGDWDANGKTDILVSGLDSTLHVVSFDGNETTNVTLPKAYTKIELGRHQSGPRLLAYDIWGQDVTVFDTQGQTVWTYATPDGVNGAHWGDLDGDGNDELIVGFNGSGGLRAVSSDGKELWKVTDIGNVWTQAVVPARGNVESRVIATEAGGSIQIFDAKGTRLKTLQPHGKYFSQVAAARPAEDQPIQIIAMRDVTIAVDEAGQVAWSTPASEPDADWNQTIFAFGDMTGDGVAEWAFVDITGELVLVTPQGKKVAALPDQKKIAGFVVAKSPEGGLLVTLQSNTVTAYKCE